MELPPPPLIVNALGKKERANKRENTISKFLIFIKTVALLLLLEKRCHAAFLDRFIPKISYSIESLDFVI